MDAGGSTNTFARISMLSSDFIFLNYLLGDIVLVVRKRSAGSSGWREEPLKRMQGKHSLSGF